MDLYIVQRKTNLYVFLQKYVILIQVYSGAWKFVNPLGFSLSA